jgi:hypothetical protein|tara:strand:+ start:150 stop:449 length:300 start_codon:yes stop_codon:yes gene_type:complete
MPRTQASFNENLKNLTTTNKKTIKTKTIKKKEEETITFSKTKDGSKFLNNGITSFIFRFEDRRKEPQLNLAWFRRFDEVEDHVKRYKLKKKDYRIFKKV